MESRKIPRAAWMLATVLAAVFLPQAAQAATRTWDGSTSSDWETGTNWSGDTVPVAADSVVFVDLAPNNSREDIVVGTDLVLAGMTFGSGFGGTLSYGNNERILVKGDVTLSSGTTVTFGAPSRLVVTGSFSMAGGTFNHSTGAVFLTPLTTATPSHTFGGATFKELVIGDAVAVTSGLVGRWKLDESADPAADAIGSNDLTWNGTPGTSTTRVAPLLGTNARAYDMASGDYLEKTGVSTFQLTTWTLSTWFKDTGAWGTGGGCGDGTGAADLVNVGNDYLLRVCNTATAGVAVLTAHVKRNSGGVYDVCTSSNTFAMNNNVWHLATATKTGNTLNLYLDGVKTSCTTVGTQNATGTVLRVSRHTTSTSYDFKGRLDDVRIYNRVLTDRELVALWAGSAEAGGTVSHSSSGTATVSGNLSIGGVTWSGSSAINLGGSWNNTGGYYTGTGLVTLNGTSTTNLITSNGQRFNALTVSGTGTWTLQDRLWVDGALTQSAGTLDTGSYVVHAGNLSKTAGTLTVGSGTVVIDSRSAQTVQSNTALNHLRFESTTESGLVGFWKFDAGVGTTVRDWSASGNSGTLNGTTGFSTSTPPQITFDNANALTLDGSSAYMSLATTGMPNSGAAQTVAMWIYYTALPGAAKTLFESLDSSTYGYRFGIGAANTLQLYKAAAAGAGALATVDISNTTTYPLSTWRHVAWTYDGTTHRIYIDGVEKNTSSTTLVAGNVSTVRAGARATGAEYFSGRIDDVRVYSSAIGPTEVAALASGRYSGRGSGAAYTLGANATVNGTLAIDNGTLATSSYTLAAAATDATKVASLYGGGLTVGSNSATFSGGLTTYGGTTVTMNTASGALKIADGKTFTLDGTLDASTAGLSRSIACAAASSCFYGFTVGSTATATPTLNLDGLTISQLNSSGLNINTIAGSSTTFTKFDNLTFSGGTGTYQLQIAASALTLYANGLSFDTTSKTKTAKLSDTDGAGNNVRLYVGGTCSPTTDCESIDEDDDNKLVDGTTNGSDGTPDDASNDGAVIQWLYRGHTDTAGAAVGFPTSAFDWNTFAYRKTYVAYNNTASSTGRLYARDTDGYASSPTYYWSPMSMENFVGSPRFTQEDSNYYVWMVTTAGRVYKIQDSGSALTTVGGYPFRDGGSATATTPLTMDTANVYWAGNNGSGSRMIFSLPLTSTTLNGSYALTADMTAVPAVLTTAGAGHIFAAITGTLYKIPTTWAAATTSTVNDTAINGRLTIFGGIVYAMEADGTVWALNASDMSTNWSYQDTDAGRHAGGCTSANQCSSQHLFVQVLTGRVTYGDQDGHVYVVSKSGSGGVNLGGYPFRPGADTDVFATAPLVSNGIIAIGTTGGKVFLIDQQNASSVPILLRTYNFRSAISSISYDRNSSVSGEYMITTADGRLFYVSRITDPTPAND